LLQANEYIDEETAASFTAPDGTAMTLTAEEIASLPDDQYDDGAKETFLRSLGLVKVKQPEGLVGRGVAIGKRVAGAAVGGFAESLYAPEKISEEFIEPLLPAGIRPIYHEAVRGTGEISMPGKHALWGAKEQGFDVLKKGEELAQTPTGGPITDVGASALGGAVSYVAGALVPSGAVVKTGEKLLTKAVPSVGRFARKSPRLAAVPRLGVTGGVAEVFRGEPKEAPRSAVMFTVLGAVSEPINALFGKLYARGAGKFADVEGGQKAVNDAVGELKRALNLPMPSSPTLADNLALAVGKFGTARVSRAGIAGAVFGVVEAVCAKCLAVANARRPRRGKPRGGD